jgi:hypothetical protein
MKQAILLGLTIILLVLAYLPILSGQPRGWSLYAYWTILALAELIAVGLFERGGGERL